MCPCPCGYYNDPVKECICSNSVITRYQKRNSGLMLDRIDFYTEVQRVEYDKLSDDRLEEKLSGVQVRVEAARQNVCADEVVPHLSLAMPGCAQAIFGNSANSMKPATP